MTWDSQIVIFNKFLLIKNCVRDIVPSISCLCQQRLVQFFYHKDASSNPIVDVKTLLVGDL